jgi:hypothetical protein
MSDEAERETERAAAAGDHAAGHRALQALVRKGAEPSAFMRWLPGYPCEGEERPDGGPFDRGYIGWSPGGDYMPGPARPGRQESGWGQGLQFPTWAEAKSLLDGDPDLNLVVDFYFTVQHDTTPCEPCQRTGLSPEAIADRAARTGPGRLEMDWYRSAAERMGDAINCPLCAGAGETRAGPDRLVLNLWLLHPRKGAARGVEVREVKPEELEEVRAHLLPSWERLQSIWSWVRTGAALRDGARKKGSGS